MGATAPGHDWILWFDVLTMYLIFLAAGYKINLGILFAATVCRSFWQKWLHRAGVGGN